MKTSELIAVLQRRLAEHGDLDVMTTWEGTTHDIYKDEIYVEDDVLYIDAGG